MNDAAWSPRVDPPPALRRWRAPWQALARQPRAIDAAIWFHDAVCDPQRTDNQALSAELARTGLARVDAEAYREGRRRVLDGSLAREAVYHTPALHEAWQAAARAKLARARQALLDGSSPGPGAGAGAGPGAGQTG